MRRLPEYEDLTTMLPTEAYHKGYILTWWRPWPAQVDPVILEHWGAEVYRWDYIPSMAEVWEKIKELEAGYVGAYDNN
jgi:hypothetical protein